MPDRRSLHWLLVLSLTTNALLAGVIVVRLRVSPSDVMATVQSEALNIELATQELIARQNLTTKQLDDREEWMIEFTRSIRQAAADRWTATNERNSWEQVFSANPQIHQPNGFESFNVQPAEIDLPKVPVDK